jgi:hypothetical protein
MLRVFEQLEVGDLVELKHQVKVGFRQWETTTAGRVVEAKRRRHGLHHRRQYDDKVFSDVIVLRREDGELTTVTLDEFSQLRKIAEADLPASQPSGPSS